MFELIGKYQGCRYWEQVDQFDTMAEAERMLEEYRCAYGQAWIIQIKRNDDEEGANND
jgi:hypothetical protein